MLLLCIFQQSYNKAEVPQDAGALWAGDAGGVAPGGRGSAGGLRPADAAIQSRQRPGAGAALHAAQRPPHLQDAL